MAYVPYDKAKSKPKRPAMEGYAAVSSLLGEVGRQLRLDDKVQEFSLIRLWPEVAGPDFARQSEAVKVERRNGKARLQVLVFDAGVATNLGFALEGIREALNAYAPQTGVRLDAIDLRLGRARPKT